MTRVKDKQPKNKKITLKLRYRDEVCRHCGKTFRAGFACEGYMDWNIIGYSSVGIGDRKERHGHFCNVCMEDFIYRFIGEPSILDHDRAPSKLYGSGSLSNKRPRTVGMMIKGDYVKYDKKKFEKATRAFVKQIKKTESWNIVDYEKFGGYKR